MLWLSLFISLALAVAAGFLLYRADKKRAVPYPIITAALRGTVTGLTLLLLLAPQIRKHITHIQKPIIVFIQDNSRSAGTALGAAAASYQAQVKALNSKLAAKYTLVTRTLDRATDPDSLFNFNSPATNLAAALEDVAEVYGQQNLGAVVLATDGHYNQGANPLYTTLPMNGTLYALAIGDTAQQLDLRISKVYHNKVVSLNSQFEIRADVVAKGCTGYHENILLRDASGNTLATAPVNINNSRFDGTVSFSIKADKARLQHYTVVAPALESEANKENNEAAVFVTVTETKKKVLLLSAAPHPDLKAINEAMSGLDQYSIDTRISDRLPDNAAAYDCIILYQLPAGSNIAGQLASLKKNIWYIAGAQTYYPQLNQLQQGITFGAANMMRDAYPVLNNTFSVFSLPADIGAIADKLPPLSVPAGEWKVSAAIQPLFNQTSGQALWAFYAGNSSAAFLCGEGLWRWRMYEYKHTGRHEAIDECIRQTISFLTADNKEQPFRAELPKYIWTTQEHIQINARLYNSNNELINEPAATITVMDSADKARNFSFERNANTYRLNMGALPAGNYHFKAQATFNGKAYTEQGNFAVTATELEAQETGCDYPLLYALAQKNNGAVYDAQKADALYETIVRNSNIKPMITETVESAPLIEWKWYFFLILLVAAAEWLLRKYWMAM